MKRKLEDKMKFVMNSFASYKFKGIFLVLIINSLYGVFDIAIQTGFFNGLYSIYNSPWYNAILFLCLFVNTLNICDLYKKNYSVIIRHKTKKNHHAEMFGILLISNILVFILSLMLTCIPLFFKYLGDFSINTSINGINVLLYLIYHLCRYTIIISLLSLIIYCIFVLINSISSLLFSILLALSLIMYPISYTIETHFKIFFGYYLLFPQYENMTLDIHYSLLLILILVVIVTLLFQIVIYSRRDIGK